MPPSPLLLGRKRIHGIDASRSKRVSRIGQVRAQAILFAALAGFDIGTILCEVSRTRRGYIVFIVVLAAAATARPDERPEGNHGDGNQL